MTERPRPGQVRQLAEAALKVARHVHDGGYDGIIVTGGSHEVSRALVALGWHELYPDTPLPHTYALDADANRLLYKRDETASYPTEFEGWMRRKMPELEAAKKDRLCMLDDIAISGEKQRILRFKLGLLGFADVGFAFFAATESAELMKGTMVADRDAELVRYLHGLGLHIQGKEDVLELLDEVRRSAHEHRADALEKLREVGRELKGRGRM